MLTAFLMLAMASGRPDVVATFNVKTANPDGVVAEQIRPADHVSKEAYANDLVAAEGLTSWGPADPTSSAPGATLAFKARHAKDGREVVVYYSPAVETVCRIRRQRGGLSDVHQAAIRWCAASLGTALPAKLPPAVVSATHVSVGAELFIRKDLKLERYRASSVDLNGDGASEVVVYANEPRFCGGGGCDLYVLTRGGAGYKVVTKLTLTRPPVRVLGTSSHGWSDLGVRVAGGGITQPYEARLRFNGLSYPKNPTIAPVLRSKEGNGRTLLE